MLFFLLACDPTKTPLLYPSCVETPAELGRDEQSPLGFAPADMLSLAEGAFATPFDWVNRPDSALSLTVTDQGTARYVEAEAHYPDSGTAPAIGI